MAGFNIEGFKTAVKNNRGLMRTNKFLLTFPAPVRLLTSVPTDQLRNIEMFCEQVSEPGVNISTHEVRRYGTGYIEKHPILNSFQDVTAIFYADANSTVHTIFYRWLQLILNFDMSKGVFTVNNNSDEGAPFEVEYKYDYSTDLSIVMYREDGTIIKRTVLREAFPTSISELPLNWQDANSIARYAVQFAYTDWFVDGLSNIRADNLSTK